MRTLEHLEKYFDVAATRLELLTPQVDLPTAKKLPELSIKVGLTLRHDFAMAIEREEAKQIRKIVMEELGTLHDGFVSTIVGGYVLSIVVSSTRRPLKLVWDRYRRGKLQGNDVDLVIGHSSQLQGADFMKGIAKKVSRQLYERSMVWFVLVFQ